MAKKPVKRPVSKSSHERGERGESCNHKGMGGKKMPMKGMK